MNVDCVLDTNVLAYAASGRGKEERKRKNISPAALNRYEQYGSVRVRNLFL